MKSVKGKRFREAFQDEASQTDSQWLREERMNRRGGVAVEGCWESRKIIKMGYGEETLESFAIFSFALSFVL